MNTQNTSGMSLWGNESSWGHVHKIGHTHQSESSSCDSSRDDLVAERPQTKQTKKFNSLSLEAFSPGEVRWKNCKIIGMLSSIAEFKPKIPN